MKTEEIQTLFGQFEKAAATVENVECWSARELQPLLGYAKWENFSKVIEKAKESCRQVGHNVANHFPDVRKMVPLGSGAVRADLRVCPPRVGKRADDIRGRTRRSAPTSAPAQTKVRNYDV